MHKIRQMMSKVLLFAVAMLLTACGVKEETVTYYKQQEESGMVMEGWRTFHTRGDEVYRIGDMIVVDYSSLEEALWDEAASLCDAFKEAYESIEGAECVVEKEEGEYTISVSIEVNKETLEALSAQGMLDIKEGAESLSLKEAGANLEAEGYRIAED